MVHSAPAIVFGTAGISSLDTEAAKGIVSVLEKHNVKELDTAYVYVRYPNCSRYWDLLISATG
jgi:aflatoxin B1 aldehyde reductase